MKLMTSTFVILVVFFLSLWLWRSEKAGHALKRFFGAGLLIYGLFLSFLTSSALSVSLPGVGNVVVGAASGAGIGLLTWLAVGTLGIATGGVGIAAGAGLLMLIGGGVGAVGATSGSFGVSVVHNAVVNPILWFPVAVLGVLLLLRPMRRNKTR